MESAAEQWNRINRRKGLTMQDFQKTLLTGIVTTIATMMATAVYMLPKFQAETAANYEYVIKSIDSYNKTIATLAEAVESQREHQERTNKEQAQATTELKIDIAVIKNNIEIIKKSKPQ